MRRQYNLLVSACIVAGLSCIEAQMQCQRVCFVARKKSVEAMWVERKEDNEEPELNKIGYV